ncbi:hypothetical protein [Flavobacterium alkalisoli]|uniref:hypothetical protein n=1 Tax=Flavobacterium alkalisoli TaxID=2602769 RepID=UPI003A932573
MEEKKESMEVKIARIEENLNFIKTNLITNKEQNKSELLLHRWIIGGLCVAVFGLYVRGMGAL